MQILGEVGRRFTRKHQLHGKVNLAVEQIVLRFSVRALRTKQETSAEIRHDDSIINSIIITLFEKLISLFRPFYYSSWK